MSIINPHQISFGDYVTAHDVRDALQSTIENWIVTYLAEMSRHDSQDPTTSGGTLPAFLSYPDSLDISRYPEEQLPACIMVVPGLTEPPRKTGAGKINANWSVGIGVAVTGQNKSDTLKLAQLYATAVRLIILQKSSLGNFATGVQWLREEYTGNILRSDDLRTMAIGVLEFTVSVDSVADESQGPVVAISDNEPVLGWDTVETPSITLTGDTTEQEL